MRRLVIVDGNAILHRAFHAIPPLTSPDGTLTNAAYGFTSMLIRLTTDLQPTHLVVAFDRPKPTFRKKLFADYQIKRPKMDEGLVNQIPLVHDLLEAFNIPVFEQDGFEADDVIGTIVTDATKHTKKTKDTAMDQVIIVTGDKDLLQLINDRVYAYMPTKGLSEAKLYGPKETEARLGVRPDQIPDFKALSGDQSDNYPGVPGIGPKTAQQLLTEFGTVDKLYQALEADKPTDIPEGTKIKLVTHKNLAMISKTLATIKTDVPMTIHLPPVNKEQFETEKAISLLQHLGFQSLVKRLQKQTATEKTDVHESPRVSEKKQKQGEQMSLV